MTSRVAALRLPVSLLLVLMWAAGHAGAQSATPLPEDWLDADEWHLLVRYIITPDELASYLQTEQQQAAFIDTFWRRRDTNRQTPRNEFIVPN